MPVRTAITTTAPILATTVLGIAAIAAFAGRTPHRVAAPALEPAFSGTCDRPDYALLADHVAVDGHFACQTGRFAKPGAFVMNGREVHVFGAGMRDLATPHAIMLGARDSVAVRVLDVDGDGTDEILLWSVDAANLASCTLPGPAPVICKPVQMRLIAIHDGALAVSDWHRYATTISPLGAARWILTHDHFGAEK